mgnify:CR=1 FL=1
MIDLNKEIEMHVGDRVCITNQRFHEGSIEAIRVISNGEFVENFKGAPDRIVVTIHCRDGIINKRGIEVTPLS